MNEAAERVAALEFWSGPVEPEPLTGGITNVNFVVEDEGEKYVVRIGNDVPVHRIMRFNEVNAAHAAEHIGISPAVVHHQSGILITRYIEAKTLEESDVRDRTNLPRVIDLIQRCHREMAGALRGPALAFWPFHCFYDYAHTLRAGNSRMIPELRRFLDYGRRLERAVGRGRTVFCHNDLLAANLLDDGSRLWLIDWDYGGFGNPLFDLGGLASNSQLSEEDERWLLDTYFEREVPDRLHYRFCAMKAVSLLREAMWSMVAELYSDLDVDYIAYTDENLARFEQAWQDLCGMDS